MQLPFSTDAFLDVIAQYNTLLWPFAILLWVATVGVFIASAEHRDRGAWTFGLLAFQWAWGAIAYHAALFTKINPMAWLFAALFLAEAGILVWYGVARERLRFANDRRTASSVIGYALIVYGLLYPAIALSGGHSYPRVPTFGLPCPTTLLTAGFLMLVPRPPALVMVVPIAWAVIGGSASALLGMPVDLALFVAGLALLMHVFVRARTVVR
jgi:uncharacterized protein DUF6064